VVSFDVSLTVHLSIILVINQLIEKILFYNKFIICLYMFRTLCAHRQEVEIVLYSIWYHHTCRWSSGAQVERKISYTIISWFVIWLYMFRAICVPHQEVKIVWYSIWYHHTCRWPSLAQVHLCTGRPLELKPWHQKKAILQFQACMFLYWYNALDNIVGGPWRSSG